MIFFLSVPSTFTSLRAITWLVLFLLGNTAKATAIYHTYDYDEFGVEKGVINVEVTIVAVDPSPSTFTSLRAITWLVLFLLMVKSSAFTPSVNSTEFGVEKGVINVEVTIVAVDPSAVTLGAYVYTFIGYFESIILLTIS